MTYRLSRSIWAGMFVSALTMAEPWPIFIYRRPGRYSNVPFSRREDQMTKGDSQHPQASSSATPAEMDILKNLENKYLDKRTKHGRFIGWRQMQKLERAKIRICPTCGDSFSGARKNKMYDSKKCRDLASTERRKLEMK